MIKWYENLSRELNIPLFMIDIPFNPDYEVSKAEIAYVKAQFFGLHPQTRRIYRKKWSDEKYEEVRELSKKLKSMASCNCKSMLYAISI